MTTTAQTLMEFCNSLADERNALVERIARLPSRIDQSDLTRMAELHNALLAAKAVLATHQPKLGSGSEE
jgi:hypothetical protein